MFRFLAGAALDARPRHSGLFAGRKGRDLMNWTKSLFWLWAAGSALWVTWIGLLPRDNGEDAAQVIALSPPLAILAIAALVWAFRVLLV